MRTATSKYSESVAPLQASLKNGCKKVENRTKLPLIRGQLSEYWGLEQYRAFQNLKDALMNATSLTYPREGYSICTDGSDNYSSAIILMPIRYDGRPSNLEPIPTIGIYQSVVQGQRR